MEEYFGIERLRALADLYLIPFAINLLIATLIFVVGRKVAQFLTSLLTRVMSRANIDQSLVKFVTDLAYALMLTVIVIAALERLGVKTTAAIAVIGAMGLAIGLALQGSLGNFASGVMVILFKPYRVGDLVKLDGHVGNVDAIQVFNTVLITPDHRKVIIPNGNITGHTIENLSALGLRRVDLIFGISYADDIDKAKRILLEILTSHPKVLKDPAPTVAVSELGNSSVSFVVRPYVDPANYWDVWFEVTEAVKKQFDANGVHIPFPQTDVHLYNHNTRNAA